MRQGVEQAQRVRAEMVGRQRHLRSNAVRAAGLLAVLLIGLVIGLPASAREWYRYRNAQGVVELNQSIPPNLVDRGYTVLDESGRVLRVVPSRDERVVLDARAREELAVRKEREARDASDQDLMRMFSSGEDVERARDRRLDSIRAAMAITQSNLRRLTAQKAAIEEQGRRAERSGRAISPDALANLKVIDGQIRDRKAEIEIRRLEHQKVKRVYDENARRVRVLYGQASSPAGG